MMKDSPKRQASVRLLALCLGTSAMLIAPSAALGADLGTGGTVRATIGDNGAVTSVKQVGANGSTTGFSGQLPVKMTISHAGQTYTYHVENTFAKTQTVHFTDTAGNDRHTTVSLQLPLVAQLGVDVPGSMTNLSAAGASITTGANGVRHLLWNMVLFSPLGSSAQDVSFTAGGSGSPVAELRATPVNPSTAPGLSAKSQDKTAEFQQEDFWAGYASGGNDGLKQLADGTNAMIVGLGQLLSGLKTGVSGANQLADGSAKAHTGSVQLRDGLQQIHAGLADTPAGLTGGLRLINGGQVDLTAGLKQVRDGLAQLAVTKKSLGLKAAQLGTEQINAGVAGLLNGLRGATGTVDNPGNVFTASGVDTGQPSVLKGLMSSQGGLDSTIQPLQSDLTSWSVMTAQAGTTPDLALLGLINPLSPTFDATLATEVTSLITNLTTDVVPAGVFPVGHPLHAGGVLVQVDGGLQAIIAGLQNITLHLDHGTGPNPDVNGIVDPVGIKGGLEQLLDPNLGLPAAVDGINKLYAGSKSAFGGSAQLAAGSGKALDGSEQLLAGSGTAYSGSKDLASGLGQIATGNKQVADGLPPAVDGVQQLLDGSKQVHDGIVAVNTGATGPLATQLTQASQNAHQQIAVLNAASGLSAQSPGGAGTSYVLAQPGAITLAANATTSGGNSHTGRNATLIAIGGVLALAIGLGAGLAVGRQRVSA
jgi:putative membrane protein